MTYDEDLADRIRELLDAEVDVQLHSSSFSAVVLVAARWGSTQGAFD
jgi:hypothetical protein